MNSTANTDFANGFLPAPLRTVTLERDRIKLQHIRS